MVSSLRQVKRKQSARSAAREELTDERDGLVHHLTGHYLGIEAPKRWAMKQLKLGYYPAPHGFQSWEERHATSRIEDARARLERVRQLDDAEFEINFETWVAEMGGPDQVKKRLDEMLSPQPRA